MDRTDPCTCQHRNNCLRDHRHVNDNAVTLCDTQPGEATRTLCCAVTQLPVGKFFHGFGDRAVVNQCDLVSPAILHVPVKCIITAVQDAATKPACKRRVAVIKNTGPTYGTNAQIRLPAPRILQGAQLTACTPSSYPNHSNPGHVITPRPSLIRKSVNPLSGTRGYNRTVRNSGE